MGHSHHHHDTNSNLKVAFFLNFGFSLLELIGGLLTNSVAILSDALHDLGDSVSLGTAWFLNRYSTKSSDANFSYGYRRFSMLGAFINSVILIAGSLFVISEAIPRLRDPEDFNEYGVVLIALIGIGVNGLAVLRLKGSTSLNARVVMWHLVEDVLGWAAVLIVGLVSIFVNAPILDPILSLLITAYLLVNAIRNLAATVKLFMQAIPENVDLAALEQKLRAIDGVQSTHHTHVWSLDGEHNVFTTHLVLADTTSPEQIRRIKQQAAQLVQPLHLEHTTIEIEFGEADCSQHVAVEQH